MGMVDFEKMVYVNDDQVFCVHGQIDTSEFDESQIEVMKNKYAIEHVTDQLIWEIYSELYPLKLGN